MTVRNGTLEIVVTESLAGSPAGTFYGVAPAQGTYTTTTTVEPGGAALKGVAAYGDGDNALGLGVSAGRLVLWKVEKKERQTLVEQPLSAAGPVHLRMEVRDGRRYQFAWSADGRTWTAVSRERQDIPEVDGDYLPPWDRGAEGGPVRDGREGRDGHLRRVPGHLRREVTRR